MKKFLVILAVLNMAQVFAAPNPRLPSNSSLSQERASHAVHKNAREAETVTRSPSDSSLSQERASDAIKKNAREAGTVKGAGGAATGVNAVAISSITQTPTASSGSGIAASIVGAADLPPIVLNCF